MIGILEYLAEYLIHPVDCMVPVHTMDQSTLVHVTHRLSYAMMIMQQTGS